MNKQTIKDDQTYAVVLSKSIRVGRTLVHPASNNRLRGDALKAAIEDDPKSVKSYEPV